MVDPCLCKLCSVILGFIKTDNVCNAKVAEHLDVIFWGVASPMGTELIDRTHEGDVFPR